MTVLANIVLLWENTIARMMSNRIGLRMCTPFPLAGAVVFRAVARSTVNDRAGRLSPSGY